MTPEPLETLPPEAEIAVGHSSPMVREALRISLWLDRRLARIVMRANEPLLAQMRLAWWREQLASPLDQRPKGDAVLDAISRHWFGQEPALSAAVDGWECMLDGPPLSPAAARDFARGRSAPFAALAQRVDPSVPGDGYAPPGMVWALVDAAQQCRNEADRATLLAQARDLSQQPCAGRGLRGAAVLDALARRALRRGGRPLMEGRGAALIATRAAILGW